jgi:transcriptional regulator with XRE-family HTH domain
MKVPDLYPFYRIQLRHTMKTQGVSYAEMGRRIGLSESGIKKIFAAHDISLGRLAQLCAALDLPLAELIASANDAIPDPLELSPEAEAYFLKDRTTFHLFFLLLTEPKSFRDIAREYNLPADQTQRSLLQLEKMKLIERLPGDRVVLQVQPGLFKGGGSFINRLVREWSHDLVDEMLPVDGQHRPDDVKNVRLLYLLPQSQRDMQVALEEVSKEFTARSFRERKVHGKRTTPIRLLVLSRPGHYVPNRPKISAGSSRNRTFGARNNASL